MANIMKVAYRQSLLNPKVRSLKLDLISDDGGIQLTGLG
jgi:hypothetical protein